MSNKIALIDKRHNNEDLNILKDVSINFNKTLNKDILKIIESDEYTERYIKIINEYKYYSISVIESYFINKSKYINNNNNLYKFINIFIIILSYLYFNTDYCNCFINYDINNTYYDIIRNNLNNNFNYTYTENNFSYNNIYNYFHIILTFFLNLLNIMIISACTIKTNIKILFNNTKYL